MSLLAIGKVVADWLYDTFNTQRLGDQGEFSCRLSVRVVRRDPYKISDSWFGQLLHVPSIRTQVDESRGVRKLFLRWSAASRFHNRLSRLLPIPWHSARIA